MSDEQRFVAEMTVGEDQRPHIVLPFDPDEIWGVRARHLLAGTIAGYDWRGEVEQVAASPALRPGPAWFRDRPVRLGSEVEVVIGPEGPQRDELDPDVAAALGDDPEAGAFFDGLAQFYRRAYLTWVGATKRRPDERTRRIAEMVRLLHAGEKQRPR